MSTYTVMCFRILLHQKEFLLKSVFFLITLQESPLFFYFRTASSNLEKANINLQVCFMQN